VTQAAKRRYAGAGRGSLRGHFHVTPGGGLGVDEGPSSPHEDLVGGLPHLADVLVQDVVVHRLAVPRAGRGGADLPYPVRRAVQAGATRQRCEVATSLGDVRTGAVGVVVLLRAGVRRARQRGGENLQRDLRGAPGQVQGPLPGSTTSLPTDDRAYGKERIGSQGSRAA
jgi:hypothetical protein